MMANLLDRRAQESEDMTGATLPVATSSNLLPSAQPDLARETTRGAAMSANTGETVTVPKTDWFRALRVAGLAMKDISASLQGQQSNFLMQHLLAEEGLDEKKAAGQRAERAEARAERADQRAADLAPLQKQLTQAQLRRVQLETGKDFVSLYGSVDLDAMAPEDQAKHRAAIRVEAEQLGINPVLTETVFTDRGFLRFLKPRVAAIREHLTPQDAAELQHLMKTARPEDRAAATKSAELILQRAVERKAVRSVNAFAQARGGKVTQDDLNIRFADDPTVLEAISQSPVLASLRQKYGLVGAKAAEKAEESAATEKTPARLREESRAKKEGELEAQAAAGGTEPSAVFKALDNKIQAFLAGRGQTNPTAQQVEEARLAVKHEGDAEALSRSLRTRAVAEMNRREGAKTGKTSGKADALFSNLADGDVKLLAVGDENVMAALLKSALGGGAALKNGKTKEQNIAELMKNGRTRQQADAEVNDLIKRGKL